MKTHSQEKPYPYSQCDKAFIRRGDLETYMRIHTREKSYQCNWCDKAFAQHASLTSHMRTHTGEEPHQCNHCDMAFSKTSNLKSHLKKHRILGPLCLASLSLEGIGSSSFTFDSHISLNQAMKKVAANLEINHHINVANAIKRMHLIKNL